MAKNETVLEAARRYVRECELSVEQQKDLVTKLKASKQSTAEANETLVDLVEILRLERVHLTYLQSFEVH